VKRILGLDAGERRIGVAISDPDRRFALPLRSIDATGAEESISRIVAAEEVTEIVVGLPLSLSGEASAQTERARAFGRSLEERLGLPVQFWDERLSTQEAIRLGTADRPGRGRERRTRRTPIDTDSIAASIILQAFLDRMRFERGS
jgi:putative pre-16S rRNA nuclease